MKRAGASRLWKTVVALVAIPVRFGRQPFRRTLSGEPSLADSLTKLKAAAAELQPVSAGLEKRFLSTGAGVEKLAAHGADFVSLSEKLLNSATGRLGGSAMFLDAVQVVERPLEFLNGSHAETRELLQRLKQTNERIDEFINIQAELQSTIAPLQYIQTLFTIESAPLGEEVQARFGALTKEIKKLHEQVCELFTTKFLELRAIQRTINEVIRELQAQTDQLWAGIVAEKAQIEKSLHKLQAELLENQKREPRISRVGKEINQDIQQIVVGLQYQDIISQKLQHTASALAQVEEILAAPDGVAFLGQLCRLEAGQIKAVSEDLAGAEKSIKSGVENILGRLIMADSQCLTLAEFQQLTTSADGMVQVLFDVFDTVRKQIASTAANTGAAFEKLRPIGGLASDLTVVVRDLSQRIHLIGINAQVQAAQVRQGVALEVLSARTSEISRATTRLSESVAQHLDQLVLGLTQGVKELEASQQAAWVQQQNLADEGALAERNLHALRDEALGTLLNLNTLLENIRNESDSISLNLDFVESAKAPLAELQSEMENIIALVGRTTDATEFNAGAFVQKFQNGYTMNSERDVLASVVQGHDGAVAAPATTAVESTVELFDDPEPIIFNAAAAPAQPLSIAPEKTSSPPQTSVNGTLAAATAVAPSASPATGLGDNVELF